jgi:hypothetical protein
VSVTNRHGTEGRFGLSEATILQLIPSGPGWYAQYRDGAVTTLNAVAMWALVEAPGHSSRIVGIAPAVDGLMSCHAEEGANFERYVFVSPSMTQVPGARG